MNVLFVPSIGLDDTLLRRLAASCDFPVKYKVAFNNGNPGALQAFEESHPDWIVKDSPVGNRGVAGNWNDCAKWFSSEPYWMLMNEDAYFLPDQLRQFCVCAAENSAAPLIFCNDTNAFYCFIWTHVGRAMIGDFDENFWPAYYEDCDYRVRMRQLLLDVERQCVYALQGKSPVPHGKLQSGGTNYNAMLQGCGLLNRAYWLKKWGAFDYEKATYPTPYRDQRLSSTDWVYDPAHRAELWPLWRTFMQLPNPSIYD